ncbi:response regulator [Komarekiella sp. 'clone 1']|uniref:Response regulator n=1 Tax=Komarekiella delphini-convector SJRDD-AB1 TaxID=2593771 RepID=A0AA40T4E9_9NOST|nr:response regulator [Komarekiella delphini-convector]MBD6620422.1 response regulator [Komarekiella delphini-convector SJRDD-AB1]
MTLDLPSVYSSDDRTNINIFQGVTILVVDDHQDMLLVMTQLLESYGIQVLATSSALTGLEVTKQTPVDLLISDITMPYLDGYWLIQKIRSLTHPQTCSIPAIAFTGNTEDKADKKALASGFQAYIQKPSTATELITEVAKLLKSRKYRLVGDYLRFERERVA